jgi:hypothetical protein
MSAAVPATKSTRATRLGPARRTNLRRACVESGGRAGGTGMAWEKLARLAITPGHDDKSRGSGQHKAAWRRWKRRMKRESTPTVAGSRQAGAGQGWAVVGFSIRGTMQVGMRNSGLRCGSSGTAHSPETHHATPGQGLHSPTATARTPPSPLQLCNPCPRPTASFAPHREMLMLPSPKPRSGPDGNRCRPARSKAWPAI